MENIGVFFGGRSVEHEVSVITGMQIIENMDREKYNPIPIFIDKEGRWLSGEGMDDFHTYKTGDYSKAVEVFFKPVKNDYNLYTIVQDKGGLFSKKAESVVVYEKLHGIFPALHGTFGEDGCIQGIFELMNIPYVGCGVLSASVGMDKVTMKKIFQSEGIPITDYTYFFREEYRKNSDHFINEVEKLGYPVFVKPANLGSSIGISKATNREELIQAIEVAIHYDRKIVVEVAVEHPREINAAVLGYEGDLMVSACEEPTNWKEFLTCKDKYFSNGKSVKGAKAPKGKKLPADLPDNLREEIEDLAKKSFRAIDGMGDARIDFLLDGEKVYVNEVNTLPGSIAFYLWQENGIEMKDLITRLIELSKVRYRQRDENIYSIDTNLYNNTGYGAKL